MGNFHEHDMAGRTGAVIAGICVVLLGLENNHPLAPIIQAAILSAILVWIFSLVPDVDHHASKPRKALGHIAGAAAIGIAVAIILWYPSEVTALGEILASLGVGGSPSTLGQVAVLISGVGILAAGGSVFDNLLTHRGFTHSVVFASLVSIGTYHVVTNIADLGFPRLLILAITVSPAIGIVVHLGVDS